MTNRWTYKTIGFKEIVLNVDGEEHRYRTEDVLEILKQIEL